MHFEDVKDGQLLLFNVFIKPTNIHTIVISYYCTCTRSYWSGIWNKIILHRKYFPIYKVIERLEMILIYNNLQRNPHQIRIWEIITTDLRNLFHRPNLWKNGQSLTTVNHIFNLLPTNRL